ncbi:MAG: hypothetical protein QOE38_148, partial [Thermoleophilaceae bacterium]|nr:hypothetical protein [Thermoleophilaceae bacterium]
VVAGPSPMQQANRPLPRGAAVPSVPAPA